MVNSVGIEEEKKMLIFPIVIFLKSVKLHDHSLVDKKKCVLV